MTPKTPPHQARLDLILERISPETLRSKFSIPHAEWRDEFVPRFLTTTSHAEMLNELARFVAHMQERYFDCGVKWPHDRARDKAAKLLNGWYSNQHNSRAGEFAAMGICRSGSRGGLRMLLNGLARGLEFEALEQWVKFMVMPLIEQLTADERMDLAKRYLEVYSAFHDDDLESPASIVLTFPEVIRRHVAVVLS